MDTIYKTAAVLHILTAGLKTPSHVHKQTLQISEPRAVLICILSLFQLQQLVRLDSWPHLVPPTQKGHSKVSRQAAPPRLTNMVQTPTEIVLFIPDYDYHFTSVVLQHYRYKNLNVFWCEEPLSFCRMNTMENNMSMSNRI